MRMGVVVNLRGTAGSGKTELVRRVLAEYGWPAGGGVEPLRREGRSRPLGYRLVHPAGGNPLLVIGQYGGTRGGCDTIGKGDGGLEGVFRIAGDFAAAGCDVLLEGLVLSAEHRLSGDFARGHGLHVLRLDTPVEQSIRNLVARRRAGPGSRPHITRKIMAERDAVTAACARLAGVATVEALPFEEAHRRVRTLLGLRGDEARIDPPGRIGSSAQATCGV